MKVTNLPAACTVRLETQELNHLKIKLYQRSLSNKRFTQKCKFASHESTHTGKEPHQCDKTFTHKTSLTARMFNHVGIKRFQCTHCVKGYAKNST